jgi:hypothetical protein
MGTEGSKRRADVVVSSNEHGVCIFHPTNLRAQTWLAQNVSAEFHDNGHVRCGPFKAAQLVYWLALEGFEVK